MRANQEVEPDQSFTDFFLKEAYACGWFSGNEKFNDDKMMSKKRDSAEGTGLKRLES